MNYCIETQAKELKNERIFSTYYLVLESVKRYELNSFYEEYQIFRIQT